MKKKILITLLALGCGVGCAAGLSACGGGGDNGGGSSRYLTELAIVDANGTDHSTSYELGDISYGTTPDTSTLKLYLKYSDGTKEEIDKGGSQISVSYYYDGSTHESLPEPLDLGLYSIQYKYVPDEHYGASVTFSVVTTATSSPYALNLGATVWKYLEDPTMTVKKGDEVVSGYDVYAITEAKYNEIKDAPNFKQQLKDDNEHNISVYYENGSVNPGSYYLYAKIHNVLRDDYAISDFKKVTIQKADVIPTNTDNFNGSYRYDGAIGKIKLSELGINTFYTDDKPITVEWKNSKNETVTGLLQWVNPDEEVDSTNDGETRKVKFVPAGHDAGRYNEYVVEDAATLYIEKCEVDRPGFVNSFEWEYWDVDGHDIKLYTSSDYESFVSLVNVTHNGSPIILGNDGLLGTESEIGEYTYNFALKDKVNYYWDGSEDDTSDVEDKVITFKIIPLTSWISVWDYHTIDENLQVKIKLEPGTDGEDYNITPYVADSLEVKILESYFHITNEETGSGYELNTEIEAEVKIENDGSYDWIVITVKDFKEKDDRGRIILQITATGDEHYDNINRVFYDIQIEKYRYANVPACPITSGQTVQAPVGTPLSALYEQEAYPELKTKLGTWEVYMYNGSNGDNYLEDTDSSHWIKLEDTATLQEGELKCKLKYQSDFVYGVNYIDEVAFTLKGIPN